MNQRRGHLLFEALIAGVLVLLVIAAITTALIRSASDAAIARDDQEAWATAEATAESLLALPLSAAAWAPAVTGPAALSHAGWTRTITISDVADPSTAGVQLRKLEVDIAYRGRTLHLERVRWLAPPP